MNATADDFRRHFDALSDEALLAVNPADLTPLAAECLNEEIARRGLNEPDSAVGADAMESAESTEADAEPWVTVATYTVGGEAGFAVGLLRSAGIECKAEQETVALTASDIYILVPESMAAEALEVLGAELTDDELAAQAEAAGPHPDDIDAEEEYPEAEDNETATRP